MTEAFSIGDLASQTGVKVETIRYYERINLLPKPGRTSSNYRSYTRMHRDRLAFIRRARELGFTLDQIRTLLDLSESRDSNCCEVDAIAQTHLANVQQKISDLKSLQRELKDLISQCDRGAIADCRIISALSPRP